MTKKRTSPYTNAVVSPIYQTATYYFESTAQIIDYHEGRQKVGRYGRYDNPAWVEVEEKLANLDGAAQALLFPSGMSAIATTMMTFLGANDKLVFTGKGYRNIRTFSYDILGKYGTNAVSLALLNSNDVYDQLAQECTDDLKVVFLETPSNPHMYLIDVDRVRKIIGPDPILIVDSTFSTPANFQPLSHGADLVIHSCTKYLGGHADILAGSVAGGEDLIEQIRKTRNVMGTIVDPNSVFLLNRSLSTFPMRMQHINAAGQQLAEHLAQDPRIGRVLYTGLRDHPHHDLARQCLRGHGGVVTFEVNGSEESVSKFVDRLQIPYMGTNFGSAQSMVEQLGLFTYYKLSPEERVDLGITDNMIRYSIGFDDTVDAIVSDIEQAFRVRSLAI